MIQVAEAYAEGTATLDELADAHEAIDDNTDDEATIRAAVNAVFWLSPDDYKVIRTLDFATDAAGYLYAIGAGVLPVGATPSEGKAYSGSTRRSLLAKRPKSEPCASLSVT